MPLNHYRWIDYPADLSQKLRDKYEKLASEILKNATEPIAIVWADPEEDWTDDKGNDPPRNCLLITQHTQENDTEWGHGNNLASHKFYE